MSKVLIINGHTPAPISPGRLNASLVDRARLFFEENGSEVKITNVSDVYDVEAEVERLTWADIVIFQYPVNWMGLPWGFKKYLDEVLSAGLDGRLCAGDGRSEAAPKANYGMGGSLIETRYMLSLTFNAPSEAFDDPSEEFFGGKSVDDLMWPMHLNAKFIGMRQLPTFSAYDVFKNPEIADDFERFDLHLRSVSQHLEVAA